MTINGETPDIDPSTNGYAVRYMKSNAELTFDYTTTTLEPLSTDWILDGPTAWDGTALVSGTSHTTDASPVASFCQVDISEVTGCRTDAEWTVTLMLHDDAGHARAISVVVKTNDVYADEFRPTATAEVLLAGKSYAENVVKVDTNNVSGGEWDVYQVTLLSLIHI